jgi:hypothetical protein
MELDITQFFQNAAPMDYSASIAEIGRDAGPSTWRAACEDSSDYPLLDTEEKREAFKEFAQSAGFSEADEFSTWASETLNALCIQWIAGDMREAGLHADMTDEEWTAYGADDNKAGRIYRGDSGRIYFYIGS